KQKAKESEAFECEQRWKNAKADKQPDKKTKSYFEETGLFVSLCQHSFVLTVCDMVRSGEKAKYALATIDRLISTFGNGILMGYDIGCTMKGTVSRSRLLGPKAAKLQFDMCVGSFHGAAHRRTCQLQNHPQNRLGAGLSDLENAETFFSYANRIAASTRLASCYHRHQRIDMLIKIWNDDMYEALGSLLRRKYIAALKTIDSATEFLSHSSNTVEEIEGYFKDEVDYMQSFKKDLPSDTFKINYIGLLEQLEIKDGAIKTALAKYNAAAAELKPPAPKVTWEQIDDSSVLADFEILHGSRRNVLDQAWTNPKNRRCVEQLHRLQRANEEIKRLNIELFRLHTSIIDEEHHLSTKLHELHTSVSPLFVVLKHYTTRRIAVNTILLQELQRMKDLSGYTGSKLIGIRPDTSSDSEIALPQEETPQSHDCEAQEASTSIDQDRRLEIDDDIADQFGRWQGMLDHTKAS
ncbi:hypothetical protein RSAG8_13415, partial [Rhizoctonia solani AG-8 WAC10335]